MNTLSNDEFYALSRSLEKHHSIFYKMWELGKPIFVEDTNSAYIKYNQEGESFSFGLNKSFWDSLPEKNKEFVICHECLHVILNHGIRGLDGIDSIMNVAMDVAINHILINKFDFIRDDLKGWEDLCWVDTVFKDKKDIKTDQTFEYYLNLLRQKFTASTLKSMLTDDHNKSFTPDNNLNDAIGKMNESLQDDEKETLREMIEKHFDQRNDDTGEKTTGTTGGNSWFFVNISKKEIVKKKRWETIIKNWSKKYIKIASENHEQWARVNRRFVFFCDNKVFIPSEMEIDTFSEENNRIKVHFFLDTSGSCASLAKRFFKAALSLPEDKFDVELFCFDTKVYKVDKKDQKLYGFGGTSFSIIENYIQNNLKDKKYPEAVFIITDGYGNNVSPKYPKRWYWFLSHNHRECIHKDCNIYDLHKFE